MARVPSSKLYSGWSELMPQSRSTFLVHHNPGNPRNDLAKLHGARLVKAAESPRQAVLDEALVKEATGDDSMSARFLFKELFVFKSNENLDGNESQAKDQWN